MVSRGRDLKIVSRISPEADRQKVPESNPVKTDLPPVLRTAGCRIGAVPPSDPAFCLPMKLADPRGQLSDRLDHSV
jgi:hypothetical protein